MGDVEHDDGAGVVDDPVAHAPVAAPASRILSRIFVSQRVADSVGIIEERASNEFGGSSRDLLGQPGKRPFGTGPDIQVPAAAR